MVKDTNPDGAFPFGPPPVEFDIARQVVERPDEVKSANVDRVQIIRLTRMLRAAVRSVEGGEGVKIRSADLPGSVAAVQEHCAKVGVSFEEVLTGKGLNIDSNGNLKLVA